MRQIDRSKAIEEESDEKPREIKHSLKALTHGKALLSTITFLSLPLLVCFELSALDSLFRLDCPELSSFTTPGTERIALSVASIKARA